MNLYITIPENWNPNNTELINQWFEKISQYK